MTLKGEWSNEVTYEVEDVARYSDNKFYILIRPCKAGTPCADALYWNPLPYPLDMCAKMAMDVLAAAGGGADSELKAVVAPEYTKTTYSKGAIRMHEGKLYKAKQNIGTAEDWTASHWEETTVGAELAAIGGDIATLNTAVATIPDNISDDAITLKDASDNEYLITVDASGETPELDVTLIETEGGGT